MRRIAGCTLVACITVAAIIMTGCGGTNNPITGPGMLFVSAVNNSTGNEAVAIFEMASARDGDTAPDRYIEGALTGLQCLLTCANHAVGEDDDLYLGDLPTRGVLIFSPATRVDGNTAPSRELTPTTVPALYGANSIAVDTSRDILYVTDNFNQVIFVWDNAATVNGDVAPNRTITGVTRPEDIAVDQTNDRLYVCAANGDEIWELNNASTQNGAVVVSRNINGAATQLDNAYGIELDRSRDRLYVANRNTSAILVFDNVDTIDGNTAPLNVISGAATGLTTPIDIALDRERNHIYEVNDTGSDDAIRIWHNASGADGNLPPNRTIINSAGLLDQSRALSFISQ